jgi:hypothetical protein
LLDASCHPKLVLKELALVHFLLEMLLG